MYAVIRTGGKQYRVAPGDVVKIESVVSPFEDKTIEFNDVLAFSGETGGLVKPAEAKVTAEILGEGVATRSCLPSQTQKAIQKLQGTGRTLPKCASRPLRPTVLPTPLPSRRGLKFRRGFGNGT